jgi:hypothetical protein
MKEWHQHLPPEILDMLKLDAAQLNDFAGTVARMEALSKITFRRAVEAVADEQREGDDAEEDPLGVKERKVQGRLALSISAHKELIKAKFARLDAQQQFEQAVDAPKPTLIHFSAKLPSPKETVERLINMGRFDDAKKAAQIHKVEHEFDWSALDKK